LIYTGDCLTVMAGMETNSVDAIVTDPPYGLEFMGKDWDHGIPGVPFWSEALRVAKPGCHLLAFGGTRTFHRPACAIEDAEWEIRDTLMWVYGSGFPKSHNLKGEHEGWGTALKPAWEPIILARKPLDGTVAENVQKWGTGAINVDGCRIDAPAWVRDNTKGKAEMYDGWGMKPNVKTGSKGRWPANLIHDGSEEVLELFPETKSGKPCGIRKANHHWGSVEQGTALTGIGDSGSAARFFYCAKASRAEREMGLEGMEEGDRVFLGSSGRTQINGEWVETHSIPRKTRNHHPTVKPLALMRYLCRLVTPPGGTVLDPFMGSGTTGMAAKQEGFAFIGIEKEKEYVTIAEARIGAA